MLEMNIKKRLYVVLGFLILVFVIGTEWSLYKSEEIKNEIASIYTQEVVSLETINHLKGSLYRIRDRTLRIVDIKDMDEFQKHNKIIKKQLIKILKGIKNYKLTRLSEIEKKLLNKFNTNLKKYLTIIENKVYPMVINNESENSINSILHKDAIIYFREAREALNDLSEYQTLRAKERLESASKIFNVQFIFMQFFVFFVIIISIFTSKKLMYAIVNPIQKINDILKKITQDDFSSKLVIQSQDEFSAIANMLNQNIDRLKGVFSQLELANHDILTNLPNKRAFERTLENIMKDTDKRIHIVFIDIDEFKYVNELYGHETGDILLKLCANRIKLLLKKGDYISRFGGDEFSLILINKTEENIKELVQCIIDEMAKPFMCNGYEIFSSVSIGVASNEITKDFRKLMSYSDIALYSSKRKGKSLYSYFDMLMQDKIKEENELENKLRKALEDREFIAYYQPVVAANTKKLYGVEVLIRWNNNDKLVSPGKFIPILEKTGRIKNVTRYIIEDTFSFIQMYKINIVFSINLSILQFSDDSFISFLQKMLDKYHFVTTKQIVFEITESLFAQNSLNIKEKMEEVRSLGFKFSLDDFGTGYSSLSYLREYPISILKVDKSFIDNIVNDKKSQKLFHSIVDIAKALKLKVIVEGVEDIDTFNLIVHINDEVYIQGYYFYKPLSRKEFLPLVE